MAFDPQAPTTEERDNLYRWIWVGMAFSIVLVVANIVHMGGPMVAGLPAVFLGVFIPYYAFSKRQDEHFNALRNHGFAWALCVTGAWLLVQGLLLIYGGAYGLGASAAASGAEVINPRFTLPDWFNNAYLLASLMAAAFHAGFLKAQYLGGADE